MESVARMPACPHDAVLARDAQLPVFGVQRWRYQRDHAQQQCLQDSEPVDVHGLKVNEWHREGGDGCGFLLAMSAMCKMIAEK